MPCSRHARSGRAGAASVGLCRIELICRPGAGSALAALVLLFSSVHAQPEPAGFGEIHQIDQAVKSIRGETVRIVNPFGNVRIRAIPDAADGMLRATVQSTSRDGIPASVRTRDGDRGPVFEVVAAEQAAALLRVDVVVALPDKAGLDVEMARGDFTMHAATYPVRIRADAGNINLRTAGPVDVEVIDGHVTYNPPRDRKLAGGRIQTSSAPVDVLVSSHAVLKFRVVSGAAVTTDSLALLQSRSRDGRATVFAYHAGADALAIQTDHAPVRLVVEGHR